MKKIYEDDDLLVVDKPAGIVVFPEGKVKGKTLIDLLLEKYPYLKRAGEPPRYGIVHRLDKDTSGIILVAKNDKNLIFLQKQFKNRNTEKKYISLVVGHIKNRQGIINTLIGRGPKDRRKQKAYLPNEPGAKGKREAVTRYKLLEEIDGYSLLELSPKTGRKHQIRCHLTYLGHPIAGDKLYGFKNQPCPEGLNRQFLHASYLRVPLPNGKIKEFGSDLAKDLKETLNNLKSK